MDNTTEMLKGLLEGCVLEIISRGKTYGYEITDRLRKLGFDDVAEGTVYAILVRLEKKSLVETEKIPSKIGPTRIFYMLTETGQEELRLFWEKWDFVSTKINELKEWLMNDFLRKIIGDKKEWKVMESRAKALPRDYRIVYDEIKQYVWKSSGLGSVDIFKGLLDLFEESVAHNKEVLEITGNDIATFCDELLRDEKTYSEKWRQQLNDDIVKKLKNK